MAKAALLVPYLEMCELARSMVGRHDYITPMCVEYAQTEAVEARAVELEQQGCKLIVARGLQAQLIKRRVKLPVVEIHVTAQELGGLILQIRRELGMDCPKVGLVGFANMLCDTSQFDELFSVKLVRYMVTDVDHLRAVVDRAEADGCQAVIGGDVACLRARELGLAYRFIPSGEESMRNALDLANQICYAIDLELSNSAEMNTMLDFTFSGIMQVDLDGTILRANRMTFNLLNVRPQEMVQRNVLDVLPQLSQEILDRALKQGEETYAFLLPIQKKAVVVNVAPILIEGEIKGGILTFQEDKRIIEMDSELRRELYQRGYIAQFNFDKLVHNSKESNRLFHTARKIAKYRAPVLLSGEPGCGKNMIAQCIHMDSLGRHNAYISLDCMAYQPDTLDTMLFGNYTTRKDTPACIVEIARDGTLYLCHVEALSYELQYKLMNLIEGKFLHNGSNQPSTANVRIIASSDVNLIVRVEKGEFRSDLYYALNVLSLDVPPLRSRREDILDWVNYYLRQWQDRYKRYVSLTQGAQEFLENYDWPGNLNQVSSVCERIVLLAEKRSVDEVFLRRQLEQVAPKVLHSTEQVVLFKDQKAVQIAELLRKHNGNRQRVADEMGVSKTTLWRYMKKYGIEKDYSY